MKSSIKQALVTVVIAMTPLWAFCGDPLLYYAKEIRGQVVDATNKQPLAGVIVVAVWQPYWVVLGQGNHGGSINTIEVVTDSAGRYFIPGWGPRPRTPLSYLDYNDPELRYFRSNYYPESRSNTLTSSEHHNTSMVRSSEWDGKIIELKPFDGNWDKYGNNHLSNFWSHDTDCVRECPRLVLALDAETKRIEALAPPHTFTRRVVNMEMFSADEQAFLRKFKNEHNN